MFSFSRWVKGAWGNKKQPSKPNLVSQPPVVASVEAAQARVLLFTEPEEKKVEENERVIADLLFADLAANLRAQVEQADIFREENKSLRAELATLMAANVSLHSENARLQDLIKGLTGSFSKCAPTSNAETFKNVTSYC